MSDKPSTRGRWRDKRIGVLMGGRSGEREVSLRSGRGVLEALLRQGVDAVGIDAGDDLLDRLRAERIEAAFLALHGRYGEDGVVQGLLEWARVPYTGSGVMASAVAMDKNMTKRVLEQSGVPTPKSLALTGEDAGAQAKRVVREIGFPAVVKPAREGSSLGVFIVRTEEDLKRRIEETVKAYAEGLAEEFVSGMSVTVGVLGRKGAERAVPVLELVSKNEFYDYEAKYTAGMTEFHCPARLTDEATRRCQEIAAAAHVAVGCEGVSRVDAIVTEDGRTLVLEVNTLPGMTELSDLPAEAAAAGMSYDELTLEILESAGLDK